MRSIWLHVWLTGALCSCLSLIAAPCLSSSPGFAAIKMTALGNPALLERWSTALLEISSLFERISTAASSSCSSSSASASAAQHG